MLRPSARVVVLLTHEQDTLRLSHLARRGTNPLMKDEFVAKIRLLSPEKALSMAAYGESVAAYRYRTLLDKTSSPSQQKIFQEMADEEQGHHLEIQALMKAHFPGSDFVLTKADKDMVVVGPRLLEINDSASFDKAIKVIIETERLTGRFYAALLDWFTPESLRPRLKEMAEECFEHAGKLKDISVQG